VNFAVAVAPMAKRARKSRLSITQAGDSSASSFTLSTRTFGDCQGCPAHNLSAMCPGPTIFNLEKGQFSAAADTTVASSQTFVTLENVVLALTGGQSGSNSAVTCLLMSRDIVARCPEPSCRLML
jgi:hypothetical protein